MHLYIFKSLLLAVTAIQTAKAHTTFTNFFVDSVPQGDGTCVRMSNDIPTAASPIKSITGDDMACGKSHVFFFLLLQLGMCYWYASKSIY